jgi:4'-phosphopantetheinyl transferase
MSAPDGASVWAVDLRRNPEPFLAWLAPDELEQAQRFCDPEWRRRFIVKRGSLRERLAACLGLSPAALVFTRNAHGKPALTGQEHPGGLRFNISGAADLALIAIARGREVGVDLEMHRPQGDELEIAEKFFSPREREELRRLPPPLRTRAFFDCWTRKEAFLKAVGCGLSRPLADFTVSLRAGEPAALLEVHGEPDAAGRWSMFSWDEIEGYSAALVVEEPGTSAALTDATGQRWRNAGPFISRAGAWLGSNETTRQHRVRQSRR